MLSKEDYIGYWEQFSLLITVFVYILVWVVFDPLHIWCWSKWMIRCDIWTYLSTLKDLTLCTYGYKKTHLLFLCRGHTDPEDTFRKPTLAFKDRKPIYRELPFTGKWVKKCPIINSLPELKLSRHVQLKSRLFFSRLKPI